MTRTEMLLTILAEEGAEVTQCATKAGRFGLDGGLPGHPLNNEERIRQEFADLIGVYEMLGLAPPTRGMIEAKKAKVERYLEVSRSCGRLID